jgi:CHAT domain-containing protein
VQSGEGVYGLRRALVLAGAESQVISLWRAADAATQDLMVTYYQRLMDGEGRSEALRQAQREMLQSRDRRHPYYWANFIHVGLWGPLQGGIRQGKPSHADGQENAQKGKL